MKSSTTSRQVPKKVYELPFGDRIRWARRRAGLSHDRLVEKLGRSNRGHLIKIEQGTHVPRRDLRDAIADACDVPRELFGSEDDDEDAASMPLSREEQDVLYALFSRLAQQGSGRTRRRTVRF